MKLFAALAVVLLANPPARALLRPIGPCVASACDGTAGCKKAYSAAAKACVPQLLSCPVRVLPKVRKQAVAAGLSTDKYQQAQFIGFNCGGVVTIPVTDAGWPVYPLSALKLPCAWKPTEEAKCSRIDGGNPGTLNTMQPGEWTGAGCDRTACAVVAGDP